eukprot:4139075-Ditylum_brightwellii.AAC.1
MFNNQEEANTFVATHSLGYIEQWLKIWQSYFRKGINKATTQVAANTKLLMSYFKCKISNSREHLLRGHQAIHDGMDNNRPIDGIQSTMHHWLKQLQPK